MEQVAECIAKMEETLTAFEEGRFSEIVGLADATSKLEHAADQMKDDIRNQLLRRFFIPVDRAQMLAVLSVQDNLADTAEDITALLTFRNLEMPPTLADDFDNFRKLNYKAFLLAQEIVQQLDELFESGFGGAEAEKIRSMVYDVAKTEHQVDVVQRELLRKTFALDPPLSAVDLTLWMQLVKELASLSDLSENLADMIRMTLDIK
jgi:predicted phosphate transport protein (TIGR00153 family)